MNNVLNNPMYNLIPKVKIPLPPEIKAPEVQFITPPEVPIPVPALKKSKGTLNIIIGISVLTGAYFLFKRVIEPMLYPDKKERN